MFSFEFDISVIEKIDLIPLDKIRAHEQIVEERAISFLNYLKSIENYIVIPSIIICSKTFTIIDGHHRAWALKELKKEFIPVTMINYNHQDIIPHLTEEITKEEILKCALKQTLLAPKSSYHHIIGKDENVYPLIMISSLFKL